MRMIKLIATAVFCLLVTTVVAQELEVKKGFGGLDAKISGKVPRGEKCYLYDKLHTTNLKSSGKEVTFAVCSENLSGLWLGVTAIVGKEEIDMRPSNRVEGRFSKKENITIYDIAYSNNGPEVEWVARLWKTKVMADVCAYHNERGSMCSYCRKNGYHLEDPVTSARQ